MTELPPLDVRLSIARETLANQVTDRYRVSLLGQQVEGYDTTIKSIKAEIEKLENDEGS